MKKKITVLIIAVVLILLMAGAYVLYQGLKDDVAVDQLAPVGDAPNTSAGTSDGGEESDHHHGQTHEAPDFTVYDLEGNAVKLSDFKGKPTVLNFWASWCGPCQMEMPDFDEKYRELGQEVNFLMVNMTDGARETVSVASALIQSKGYTFPVYYDTDQDAAATYQVYSLPTTYFLDEHGHLIARASGAIDAETLQKGIDMIYDGT